MTTVPPVFHAALKRKGYTDALSALPVSKKQKPSEDIVDGGCLQLSCDELLEQLWALGDARVRISAIIYLLKTEASDGRSVATSHLGVSDTLNRKYLKASLGPDAFTLLESIYLHLNTLVVSKSDCGDKVLRVRVNAIVYELGVVLSAISKKTSEIESQLGPVLQRRHARTHYVSMYA